MSTFAFIHGAGDVGWYWHLVATRTTSWEPAKLDDSSTIAVFYHDVPRDLAEQAFAHGRGQSDTPGSEPWPLAAWPDIETRAIAGRNDRFFPIEWQRTVIRDRLGTTPDELDGGHCPALSRPTELAELLAGYVASSS